MADPVEEDWQEREQRAVLALDAYRERRRERRGGDTYFGSAELLEHAEEVLSKAEHERRRIEIMNDAAAAGMPPELAEMLYDIAREERLDPALGFELVHSGLGVAAPLDGVSNAPVQPTTDKYAPEWLGAPIGRTSCSASAPCACRFAACADCWKNTTIRRRRSEPLRESQT